MNLTSGSLWRPASPCGAGCLPHGDPAALRRLIAELRSAVRLAAVAGVMLGGVALLPLLLVRHRAPGRPGAGQATARRWLARTWARTLLAALGVRLSARGQPPRRGALLVANHISWLDVIALLAVAPHAVLLAKAEVRTWPVVGLLARVGGTVFLDRDRPRLLPVTVAEVTAALVGGAVVAGFPEGTTWCSLAGWSGQPAGRFRPALFQAALDAGVPVTPVAIGYRSDGRPTSAAAFVGSESLGASVRRIAAVPALTVQVEVTPALHPGPGADRRALARVAETAVAAITHFPVDHGHIGAS